MCLCNQHWTIIVLNNLFLEKTISFFFASSLKCLWHLRAASPGNCAEPLEVLWEGVIMLSREFVREQSGGRLKEM